MSFFPNSQVRVESNSEIDAEQKRNASTDHSMQSKRSVRSLAFNALLAGVSVAALGVTIQSDSSALTYTSLASAITFGAAGLSGFLANVIVDGGADTGLKGGLTSLIFEHTSRKVSITGFNDEMVQKCLPIGTSATKVVDLNGKAVILIENEQIDDTGQNNFVLSVNQMGAFGVDVDDCP